MPSPQPTSIPYTPGTTTFIIKNISNYILNIFNRQLPPSQELDLMKMTGVSEEDIRKSLLKGELYYKFKASQLQLISNEIVFNTNDPDFALFLTDIGVNVNSGSELTSLDGSNIVVGSVSDAAMSTSSKLGLLSSSLTSNGLVQDTTIYSKSQIARAIGIISTSQSVKILPVGDSRTVGSLNAGWRRILWKMFRMNGYNQSFVGGTLGLDFYKFELQDWRHEGHSGEKWSDMTAAIAARAAIAGDADVILVDLGTNDFLNHIALDTIKANAQSGVAAIRALYPSAIIIVGTTNLLPSDAAADALRLSYASWLLTNPTGMFGLYSGPFNDPLVYCIDAASSLTKGDLVDDRHPNAQGNAIIARAWYDAIINLFPIRRGQSFPRSMTYRTAATRALAVGNNSADYWSVVNQTATALHSGYSYIVTGWHNPTLVDTTTRSICSYGSYGTTGFQLAHGLGAAAKNFGVHLAGQGQIIATSVVPFFTAGSWHRFALAFCTQISATDTRPCAALWIDGILVGMATVTAWASAGLAGFLVGANATNGITASQGQSGDIAVAQWAGAPYWDGIREYAERDYYEGTPFPNRLCQFSLDNVSTDAFGGATGTLSGAAAFAVLGSARPSDG